MKLLVLFSLLVLPLTAQAQEVVPEVAYATASAEIGPGEDATVTALCEPGYVVVGGGFRRNIPQLEIWASEVGRGGWRVDFHNPSSVKAIGTARAVCLKTSSSVVGRTDPVPQAPTRPPGLSGQPAVPKLPPAAWISAGTSDNLAARMAARSWMIESVEIVGMAIASPCPPRKECSPSDDVLVMWYEDGTVSETPFRSDDGAVLDPTGERQRFPFRLPTGQQPNDIVGIAISAGSSISAWYADGTRSTGSIRDLGSRSAGEPYTLPPGRSPADIVGLGKAPSSGWTYAWYADGTVSAGTDGDLDAHRVSYDFTVPPGQSPSRIVEMAIGHGDWVFAWYGPETRASRPGAAVLLPAQPPPALPALPAMKALMPKYSVSSGESTRITSGFRRGCDGGSGIVGIAIETVIQDRPPPEPGKESLRRIYTWYQDGTVSTAWLSPAECDLDTYKGERYFLPAGKAPKDIVDMGIASDGTVYTWYLDGTVSKGTRTDLGALGSYPYTPAPGKTPRDIVGMGIAPSNDWVYAWYRQGTVSTGRSDDLAAYRDLRQYNLPSDKTPDDIAGMAIGQVGMAPNAQDMVYAWYREFLEAPPR